MGRAGAVRVGAVPVAVGRVARAGAALVVRAAAAVAVIAAVAVGRAVAVVVRAR